MYFLCTLQADLEETRKDNYIGEWMTREEKKEAILKFYKQKQHIPLSIDHTTAKEYGAAIPMSKRVGRVLDLFNDKDGDLIAKCVIDKDSKAIHRLNNGSYVNGEKWGVSVRIDWCIIPGSKAGETARIDKILTHVALTQTPYLADEGSYVHHWSTNEKAVDNAIRREYYEEGNGYCFAAPELLQKIQTGMEKFNYDFFFVSSLNTLNQNPHLYSLCLGRSSENNSIMSDETQPMTNAVSNTNIPQQEQQQSLNTPQQSPQQQNQQRDAPQKVTSSANPNSTRLVDLEAELQEMELLITPETPLQKMPATFRGRYLAKMDQIEAKKAEVKKHVNYLVENKYLTESDAQPFLKGINDTDLDSKRPIYGYLEASYEDRTRTAQASTAMMKMMEESNKRTLDEKDRAVQELELMKKKIRMNDYAAPVEPQRHRFDEFGSAMTPAPFNRETISLIRMDEKPNGEVTGRQIIHEANMKAMFNYDIDRQTTVDSANGKEQFGRLASFMNRWGQ